jgi:predicted dehydrogenase
MAAAGVRIAWAVDPSPERCGRLAAAAGASAAADAEEALADPAVDAVVLALPHHLHAAETLRALRAGKHVLCEKPLATNLADADAMIAAAEEADRVLMVAENVWYDPAFLTIRDLLQRAVIGPVSVVQISRDVWTSDDDLRARPWYGTSSEQGGGIMMAGGIHDIEKARMLLGEIRDIVAWQAPGRLDGMEADDASVALLRFESGAVGTLTESFSARIPMTAAGDEVHRLRIEGANGSIFHEGGGGITLFTVTGNRRDTGKTQILDVETIDTFEAEAETFARAVVGGVEPPTSARAQRRALELVLRAHRSMGSTQPRE